MEQTLQQKQDFNNKMMPYKTPKNYYQNYDLDREYIHVPRRPTQKENYQVVIPESIDSLGIKGRNHTKQEMARFKIDLKHAEHDGRTSLMIKNIPNKYTQQMLKETIEVNHKGHFDFLYLPIDFQNKCNVGYGFINLKSVKNVVTFAMDFDGKKWEYFKSEKVCKITYARLQGLKALKKHFQTSMIQIQKDKKLKPLILQ